MNLAPQAISTELLQAKYCTGTETSAAQVRERIARALAEDDGNDAERFYDAQEKEGVVLGGRIAAAAGTGLKATMINCFVQPIADWTRRPTPDARAGITDALAEAMETMRRGGGVGYDWSELRPRGAQVATTGSIASGPLSFMNMFNESAGAVASVGHRRGAQMAILSVLHPDILEFVHAKQTENRLNHFNLSVSVPDSFLRAVQADESVDLVHEAPPGPETPNPRAIQRDGKTLWVYRSVRARTIWDAIMESTYNTGEPGVFFIDTVRAENNLHYAETITACNPCAEQILPDYGACCLGSINLCAHVRNPFTATAHLDVETLMNATRTAVRMLDRVLDATTWPLEQQRMEAMAKRRIGLGFLGLGNALAMLGLRYDDEEARGRAAMLTECMRNAAYETSVELAREREPFPLFHAEHYLESGFAKRLPRRIRDAIAKHGLRNSHLLSIAPTGTIAIAFCDAASNGIEPPYSLRIGRKVATDEGDTRYSYYDHAYRYWCALHNLDPADEHITPDTMPTALDIAARDHMLMVASVQPHVDSSISKTVNIRPDYDFEDFKTLYYDAWTARTKSLATFRTNPVLGTILTEENAGNGAPAPAEATPIAARTRPRPAPERRAEARVRMSTPNTDAIRSLRWPRRPVHTDGNNARCYRIRHPRGAKFALFVGETERREPYEVWVTGGEAPRGLGALAVTLSNDMASRDRQWLKKKLATLMEASVDTEAFSMEMPPEGQPRYAPSLVAAMAMHIDYRLNELGTFHNEGPTPVLDSLLETENGRGTAMGTMSWTVDVRNPRTQDDFVIVLKEALVERDGRSAPRPYAMHFSGQCPPAFHALARSLSLDLRVADPAWGAYKLRKLLDYRAAQEDFMAPRPGANGAGQAHYPSTVAYVASLVVHRLHMLGHVDAKGHPPPAPHDPGAAAHYDVPEPPDPDAWQYGARRCHACGELALVRSGGCDRCEACGYVGDCG